MIYTTQAIHFFQLNSMHETQRTLNETYVYDTMKDNVPLTKRQLLLNIDSFFTQGNVNMKTLSDGEMCGTM